MIRALLILLFFGCVLPRSVHAEAFTLILRTKTGNVAKAGTNEQVFFALYYTAIVEVPNANPKRKPRKVKRQKRIEVKLDNKGDDRKVGAIDTYELKFECPIDKISAVEIGLKSGVDAWLLTGMQYVIVYKDKQSRPATIRFSGWLSADAKEKGIAKGARQYYRFKVKPPKLRPKRPIKK